MAREQTGEHPHEVTVRFGHHPLMIYGAVGVVAAAVAALCSPAWFTPRGVGIAFPLPWGAVAWWATLGVSALVLLAGVAPTPPDRLDLVTYRRMVALLRREQVGALATGAMLASLAGVLCAYSTRGLPPALIFTGAAVGLWKRVWDLHVDLGGLRAWRDRAAGITGPTLLPDPPDHASGAAA